MITKVIPPVFPGRDRTVQVVGHRLTRAETDCICDRLAQQESPIQVLAGMDNRNTVHIWALRELTTLEEVTVLAEFLAVSDSRIAWHGVVAR